MNVASKQSTFVNFVLDHLNINTVWINIYYCIVQIQNYTFEFEFINNIMTYKHMNYTSICFKYLIKLIIIIIIYFYYDFNKYVYPNSQINNYIYV